MGFDLLSRSDAVVYDEYVSPELIAGLPSRIERYHVGKRAGKASVMQEEINRLLIELATDGRTVVRLKGGDPMVFARCGEEATNLASAGIPFAIIPGVTAASATGASVGMSLTDRRAASWLMLTTGREAESASPPVPWERIAKLHGGCIVVYMGLENLGRIVERLLAGGMDPKTPGAVVENAFSSQQRILRAELASLPENAVKHGVETPALVVIGEVVNFSVETAAFVPGPLKGRRVLVCRPAERIESICSLLRIYGAEPIPHPTIAVTPVEDRNGWDRFSTAVETGGWCVFTSEAGVAHLFAGLFRYGLDVRCLGRFKVAVIGKGTSAALSEKGIRADLIPECATVDGLARALMRSNQMRGVNLVRVRGELSDRVIEDAARNAGARVIDLTVYRTETAKWEPHWKDRLEQNPPDYIAFTSGSTVKGFVEIMGRENGLGLAERSVVAAIGPSTAAVADEYGIRVGVEAKEHSLKGLIEALVRHSKGETQR